MHLAHVWIYFPHGRHGCSVTTGEIARILSPLLFFLAHVVYLAAWSPDPFLKKWLDGSFSFFLALVLANIIRARIAASGRAEDGPTSDERRGGPSERTGGGHT